MLFAEACDSFLGIMELLSQVHQTIAEPPGSTFGRFKTSIKLFDDVGVSDSVSQLRRPIRIDGGNRDREDVPLAGSLYPCRALETLDRRHNVGWNIIFIFGRRWWFFLLIRRGFG